MTQIFEIQSTIKYIYDLFVFIRTGMKKGRFISSHRDKLKKKKKNCTWNNYFDFEKKKVNQKHDKHDNSGESNR